MNTHPYFLKLLTSFKTSDSDNISAELVALAVAYKTDIETEYIYKLLYNHRTSKLSKRDILQNIRQKVDEIFVHDGVYKIRSTTGLSKECRKLLQNMRRRHLRKSGQIKTTEYNRDDVISDICRRLEMLVEQDGKALSLIEHKLKSLKQKHQQTADSSLLGFVTKRKIEYNTYCTRLEPIINENTAYVYDLITPSYKSLRQRSDLISPIKHVFIKFTDESRPPLYFIRDYHLRVQDSTCRLEGIDYDEESTWEDEGEEEIVSSESEEDEQSFADDEWIESDLLDNGKSNMKKPFVLYEKVNCKINDNFDDTWLSLPLVKCSDPSDDLVKKILNYKSDNVRYLSDVFMVDESTMNRIYDIVGK